MRHIVLVIPVVLVAALFARGDDGVMLTAKHEKTGITVSARKNGTTVTASKAGFKELWTVDLPRTWKPVEGKPEVVTLEVVGDRARITNSAGAYTDLDVQTSKTVESGRATRGVTVCSCCPLPKGRPKLGAKADALASMIRTDYSPPRGGTAREDFKHLWMPGAIIPVVFFDGDEKARKKVKEIADEWTKHANIHFRYYTEDEWKQHRTQLVDINFGPEWKTMTPDQKKMWYRKEFPAAIAITFARVVVDGKEHNSYYSAIGTYSCQETGEGKHSMRLGGLDKVTDEKEWRRVVLHEFGHALGLEHEHLSPTAGISWNEKVVIDYYQKEQGWKLDEIKHNVLNAYKTSQTKYTEFDPKSIMIYPIRKEHTLNGYSVDWNTELSDLDKKFIAELYPKKKK